MEKKVRYYKPRTGETGELILLGLPESVTAEELAAAVGAVEGEIPENVSELVNDAGYVDSAGAAAAAPVQSVNGQTGAVALTVPSKTSQLTNDSGFVDSAGAAAAAPVQSVDAQTGAVVLTTAFATVASIIAKANSLGIGKCFWGDITASLAAEMCGMSAHAQLWGNKATSDRVDIMLWQGASNAAYKIYWGNIAISDATVTLKTVANAADVPTKTSQLTNDSGFVNTAGAAAAAPVQSVNGQTGNVSLLPTVGHVNGNAVNVASGTSTTVQTITLSPGAWVLECDAQFAANATGYRSLFLSSTSGGGVMDRHSVINTAASPSPATTRLTFTTCFRVSTETTYYLCAQQNSGSTLSVTPGYRYMKFS